MNGAAEEKHAALELHRHRLVGRRSGIEGVANRHGGIGHAIASRPPPLAPHEARPAKRNVPVVVPLALKI